MVAKVADLGMARIVPNLRASTMTKAPGASIYMPPEALEDKSRYDVTIDIYLLSWSSCHFHSLPNVHHSKIKTVRGTLNIESKRVL